MESIKMTLSEKIDRELEMALQEAMQDKDFADLVKRLRINKKMAKNNNSSLQDTCNELKNCRICQGLFMCKNKRKRLQGRTYNIIKKYQLKFDIT